MRFQDKGIARHQRRSEFPRRKRQRLVPCGQAHHHVIWKAADGAFVNPTDPEAEPTIQAFCVPIVYLDRDTLTLVENTHGLTVTTVIVKPKSRGEVRLRSANPVDKPIVSPNLLKHPDDLAAMIEGHPSWIVTE